MGRSANAIDMPHAAPTSLSMFALNGLPQVGPGDDLAGIIVAHLGEAGLALEDGDVVVIAQKIVSKAEGRIVRLDAVQPSDEAQRLAREIDKDARLVQVILSESRRVVRARHNLMIMEHRQGFIMANAGVDQSNVGEQDGTEKALLLPEDSDRSAEAIRTRLEAHYERTIAVVINDSFGRPWRRGTVGVAIGSSGLPAVIDMRGEQDMFGRVLKVTEIGFADEVAAAASLIMGQAAEGRPVVVMRGLHWTAPAAPATSLCRGLEEDLFR